MKDFHKIAINESGVLVEDSAVYSSFEEVVSFLKENKERYKEKEVYVVCIQDDIPISGSRFHYSIF